MHAMPDEMSGGTWTLVAGDSPRCHTHPALDMLLNVTRLYSMHGSKGHSFVFCKVGSVSSQA